MERRRRVAGSDANKAYLSGEKKQFKLQKQSEKSLKKMKRLSSDQDILLAMKSSHMKSDLIAIKSAEKIKKASDEIEAQAEKEGKTEVDISNIVWNISDALRYTVKEHHTPTHIYKVYKTCLFQFLYKVFYLYI